MSARDYLQKKVLEAIEQAVGSVVEGEIKLEHPEVEEFGDYATNAALVIYSSHKAGGFDSPKILAEKIASFIKPDKVIAKVEVAGPGFINISLQSDYLVREIDTVINQGKDYGKDSDNHKDKLIIVEYSAPNIAKPFGIGHLRSTIVGQAIYNLYKFLGWKTISDNHLGDWGTQFGKLLYMLDKTGEDNPNIGRLEELYVEFHKLAEQQPELEEEGRRWFRKLETGDSRARELWQRCVAESLAEFNRIYKLLGVEFDNTLGESFYEPMLAGVVEQAKGAGVAKQSDGAWVIEIPGNEVPLMLEKSDGGSTYASRDLATLKYRQETWHPQIIVYEVGAEQALHFSQVFASARQLGYVDPGTRLVHTKHGLYLDQDGKKFATRKGKTVKLEEILLEAIQRARLLGNTDTAREVGIGAIKYFDLSHSVTSDIVFDWEKMFQLEGNSGPYLQYTYARIRSVISKSGEGNLSYSNNISLNKEEYAVARKLYQFGEAVSESASRFAPNLLAEYLFELAGRYNTFYNNHSILQADEAERKNFRLALSAATGQILQTGLSLLGIETPERL